MVQPELVQNVDRLLAGILEMHRHFCLEFPPTHLRDFERRRLYLCTKEPGQERSKTISRDDSPANRSMHESALRQSARDHTIFSSSIERRLI